MDEQPPLEITVEPPPRRIPSPQEIASARSHRGGWTRQQLATWGVPWPPPKGWRTQLVIAHLQSHQASFDPLDLADPQTIIPRKLSRSELDHCPWC